MSKKATVPDVPLADMALLDIKAVSGLVGLKESAIRNRIAAQDFPEPVRLSGRCSRWTVGSIRAWLHAQTTANQDDIKRRQLAHAKKASAAAKAKVAASAGG